MLRLQKACSRLKTSSDTKGEKQIVLEIKRMTEAAKTLKARAETENLCEHMQDRVYNAIEESETLEHPMAG